MPARIINNRRGSTLILVILVFALLIVFATAALTLAESSHTNSVTDWQNQQAYFTARSAVLAAVDYFKDNPDEDIDDYVGTSDESHTADMGAYSVVIKKLDATRYEISSEGEFEGKSRTVRAIVNRKAGSDGFPFGQDLITATDFTGGTSGISNGAVLYGNILINDIISLPNTVTVYGDMYIKGNISISNYATTKKVNGNGGNIYCTGNINFSNDVIVEGNVYSLGSLTFSNNVKVYGDIYCKGNATFNNSSKVYGKVNKYYEFTPQSPGMPGLNFSSEVEKLQNLFTISDYKTYINNNLKKNNLTVTSTGDTINQSGTLQSVNYFCENFTIDTTAGPISLLIPNTSVFSGCNSNLTVYVKGSNSIVLHLADGADFHLYNNQRFGVEKTKPDITNTTKPKVYIMSPYNNTIMVSNSAQLAAHIVMPFGNAYLSNSTKFAGSMLVSSSNIANNVPLYYQVPDYPQISGMGEIGVSDGGEGGGGSSGGVDLLGVYTNKNS